MAKKPSKKKPSKPDRPVFGPELPPAMRSHHRWHDYDVKPLEEVLDPTHADEYDEKWRFSKGIMNRAPQHIPYKDGGSPFRTITRWVNDRYEIGHAVDPQYLIDTGLTCDEAMENATRKFDAMLGNTQGTPEGRMQAWKDLAALAGSREGASDEEIHAKMMAMCIKHSGRNKDELFKSFEELMNGPGGRKPGFENIVDLVAKQLKET